MRTRSRSYADTPVPTHMDGFTAGSVSCTQTFNIVPSTSYSENDSYIPYEWTEVMHDIVTPNFYTLRNRGDIVNNPYDKVRTEYHRGPLTWYESRFVYGIITCNGVPTHVASMGGRRYGTRSPVKCLGSSFLAAPAPDVERVKDLAITSAFANANEGIAQGLVILAEGEKTIQSFIQIANRLLRIGRALRKWDVGYLRRQLSARELADRWMEGRYAIRPVVYDMCDVIRALRRSRLDHPIRKTYRSGASDTATTSQSGVATYSESNYYTVKATKSATRTVSARSGVLAAIDSISEATIWGIDQPFTAMWELVPFSFVVDWFLNVGKTIASWSPANGMRTLASWVTVHDTVSQTIQTEEAAKGTWTSSQIWEWDLYGSGGFVTKITNSSYRVVNPCRPILPSFNVRLDAAKLLDLVIMARRFFV